MRLRKLVVILLHVLHEVTLLIDKSLALGDGLEKISRQVEIVVFIALIELADCRLVPCDETVLILDADQDVVSQTTLREFHGVLLHLSDNFVFQVLL